MSADEPLRAFHVADEDTDLAMAHACGVARAHESGSRRLRVEHIVYAIAHHGGRASSEWLADRHLQVSDIDGAIVRAARLYGRQVDLDTWSRTKPDTEWLTRPPKLSTHADKLLSNVGNAPLSIARLIDAAYRVSECHVIEELEKLNAPGSADIKLSMLNDDALVNDNDDRLGLTHYADAIAGLIDDPNTGTSLTIAISAPWGAGKTTLARMVKRRLDEKPAAAGYSPHVTCWFNAWMHDGAKDLAGAFAAAIAREADARRPPWRRFLSPLPTSMMLERTRSGRILMFSLAFGVLAGLIAFHPEWLQTLTAVLLPGEHQGAAETTFTTGGIASAVAAIGTLLTLLPHVNTTANAIAGFVKQREASAGIGGMSEVRAQLTRLIRQATPRGSRFVLFIDDLERCQPPRPIEVLEVVNQLLSDANVVTVLMADMSAVAACADIKYRKFASANYSPDADQQAREKTRMTLSYGWLYLQKIVQIRFDVPSYDSTQIKKMLDRLVETRAASTSEAPAAQTQTKERQLLPALARANDARSLRESVRAITLGTSGVRRLAAFPLFLVYVPGLTVRNAVERIIYPLHRRPTVLEGVNDPPWSKRLRHLAPEWSAAVIAMVFAVALTGVPGEYWSAVLPATFIGLHWETANWFAVAYAATLALCGVNGAITAFYRRSRDKRTIDAQRARAASSGEAEIHAIAQEQTYQRRAAEPEVLEPARNEALRHIPPLPRTTKRLLNELRLYLYILSAKGLFTDRVLQPEHVGKWLALRERWPDLARLIAIRPALVGSMEDDIAHLKNVAPALAEDVELKTFLGQTPRLRDVAARLARFDA